MFFRLTVRNTYNSFPLQLLNSLSDGTFSAQKKCLEGTITEANAICFSRLSTTRYVCRPCSCRCLTPGSIWYIKSGDAKMQTMSNDLITAIFWQ